ncbi:sugar ABC transporter permease YjfF [Vibrio sp. S17_S38]|uniref:galactofuranose ABC transporter, permease protein YjfF n=1 Tax=Vibrio sp. S17_S38 TaxID=2720229 RepID=UPI00167FF15F|nr:galactofuranose ABC transporter, permease protein YjfF [Vibrio sp. S17_S38]MBD1572120.1 sugar ABC transporter permease YjfF [Vibrio sp. S17_S38]
MSNRYITLFATIIVFIALFGFGSVQFDNFFSMRVFTNLFTDNAFLALTAIGMTFVIISKGIDLSVGSTIAIVGVSIAMLIRDFHLHPLAAFSIVLTLATLFGAFMGYLIARYQLPPFIITLAGMFFLRGLAMVFSIESIPIEHPFYDSIADFYIPLPDHGSITVSALLVFIVLAIAIYIAHYTRLGRNIYAIGGNEQSARLLGVPIDRTIIFIYAQSSFLAALAGIVYTFYTFSGQPLSTIGLELDAIASVVIGGTLLSGGVGFVFGTLFGVLIQGVIQTIISFDGTLDSYWTRIFIGLLIFVFILLHRLISSGYLLHAYISIKRKLGFGKNESDNQSISTS